MDAVRAWLHDGGLGTYADTFESEGYDELELLLGLTESDIDELCAAVGMRAGHRLKLRKRLAEPQGAAGRPPAGEAGGDAAAPPSTPAGQGREPADVELVADSPEEVQRDLPHSEPRPVGSPLPQSLFNGSPPPSARAAPAAFAAQFRCVAPAAVTHEFKLGAERPVVVRHIQPGELV